MCNVEAFLEGDLPPELQASSNNILVAWAERMSLACLPLNIRWAGRR